MKEQQKSDLEKLQSEGNITLQRIRKEQSF